MVPDYIPVRNDMMRQTNDYSAFRVMQHKGRPSPWACGPRAVSTCPKPRALIHKQSLQDEKT